MYKTRPSDRTESTCDLSPTPPPVAVGAAEEDAGAPASAMPMRVHGAPPTPDPRWTGPIAPATRAPIPAPPLRQQRAARRWPVRAAVAVAALAVLLVGLVRAAVMVPPAASTAWRTIPAFSRALFAAAIRSARAGAGRGALMLAPGFTRLEGAVPAPAIRHEGHIGIHGGVLFTPESFNPTDSSYDLVVHFHGNTQLVRESIEVAGLNAAVAVINLGIGSGAYEDAYAMPGSYEALLADINRAIAQRGLPAPRLRRVALSAWSAGYGAISKILELRRGDDPLDAILMLDGIHCGYFQDRPPALNTVQLASFARAAQAAAAGQILFTLTHSEIDPVLYAPTSATADYLLEAAAGHPVTRAAATEPPPYLRLHAMEGAVSRKLEKQLIPTTEARIGLLHVRGFRGNTKEHHMAHLFQMATTVLPELVERWSNGSAHAAP